MEFSDKVTVVPHTNTTSSNIETQTEVIPQKEKKSKGSQTLPTMKAAEKLAKLLKIILKIASINGYDEEGRIKDDNGVTIFQSDLVSLLQKAMSYEKVLVGKNEFINLLYKANVSPELLVNDDMRARLMLLYKQPAKQTESKSVQTTTTEVETEPKNLQGTSEMIFTPQSIKRKRGQATIYKDFETESMLEDEPVAKLRRSTRTTKLPKRWIYPEEK